MKPINLGNIKREMEMMAVEEKKQGCKNTAPKNFNHIFIEKPRTNFYNLETSLIWNLANDVFYLVNDEKLPINVWTHLPQKKSHLKNLTINLLRTLEKRINLSLIMFANQDHLIKFKGKD